jgi:hypothetical protein
MSALDAKAPATPQVKTVPVVDAMAGPAQPGAQQALPRKRPRPCHPQLGRRAVFTPIALGQPPAPRVFDGAYYLRLARGGVVTDETWWSD